MANDDNTAAEVAKSFSCRTDNIKSIADILTSLYFDSNRDQPCFIEASPTEITFIVTGNTKSQQARLVITIDVFEDYICNCDSIKCSVNLTVFLDCLKLFGSSDNTTATLSYSTGDDVINLSLEELGVITTCEITSLYCDDYDDFDQQSLFIAFRDCPEECQLILKSEPLRESVQELTDAFWAGSIRFQVTSTPPLMKLMTSGSIGAYEISIPRSSEAFVSFQCRNAVNFSYPLRSFVFGMKALSVSKEAFIRVNSRGMLCVQHLIETSNKKATCLDFLMLAEDDGADADAAGDIGPSGT